MIRNAFISSLRVQLVRSISQRRETQILNTALVWGHVLYRGMAPHHLVSDQPSLGFPKWPNNVSLHYLVRVTWFHNYWGCPRVVCWALNHSTSFSSSGAISYVFLLFWAPTSTLHDLYYFILASIPLDFVQYNTDRRLLNCWWSRILSSTAQTWYTI